jgi:hypothetical protein
MFVDRFTEKVVRGPLLPAMDSHPMSIALGSKLGKDYWGANTSTGKSRKLVLFAVEWRPLTMKSSIEENNVAFFCLGFAFPRLATSPECSQTDSLGINTMTTLSFCHRRPNNCLGSNRRQVCEGNEADFPRFRSGRPPLAGEPRPRLR